MGLKDNIQTLESVITGLREKIYELSTYDSYGSYSNKSASTFKEEVLKIIDNIVLDSYKDVVLGNENDLVKEVSRLEAKVFVYEEIIKKSSFKTIFDNNVENSEKRTGSGLGYIDENTVKGLVE